MTRAAIYARKSTDDSDRNPANKSVTRQVEHARDYAKKKGWDVLNEHVYVDDNVSGAEFENRPGFAKLMANLPKRQKPPFDVLVMSESSRLGRDIARNSVFVLNIIESGVRIFYYLTDEEEKADTPEQKLMLSLKGYASEVERIKAGQRSRDALMRKASKGYNAGGVVYGYDNVQVFADGDDAKRSHTDYRINDAQADILRRIFKAYGAGHGHVTIAKALNGDPRYADLSKRFFNGARPPSPRKGTGSWAPSSVRAMLHNERYSGVITFGLRRKVYRLGTKARVKRPLEEVQRVERKDLRIIDGALWAEVQARLTTAKKTYIRDTNGKLWGRPGVGVESKYLLTGFGRCGICERNITKLGGRVGSPGKRAVRHYYGCSYHANRGRTICANDYLAPMQAADAVVLERVRSVLTPAALDQTIDKALKLLAQRQHQQRDEPERLEAEARKLRREIERFLALVADGKAPASVLGEIKRREQRLAEVERELQTLTIEQPADGELRRLKASFRDRLARFDELLLSDVPMARQALRKLVPGRIEFRPVERDGERGYDLRWSLATKALLDGNIGVASPRGFEPRLPP